MSHIATRYNASNPCPVCGTGTKSCSRTHDGFQHCRGEPADGWVQLSDNGTFRGYRHENDLERNSWRKNFYWPDKPRRGGKSNATATNQTTTLKTGAANENSPAHPPAYWLALARQYAANLAADPEVKDELARLLRVPTETLDLLPLVGYIPGRPILLDDRPTNDGQWTFPEFDAAGNVIGIARRWRPYCGGPQGDKRSITGSGRGLTIPTDFHARYPDGPILVVEGQTDTLALAMLGVAAVGRPGNKLGGDHLAQLLRDVPRDRPIVVMGENDQKPNGLWPGKDGADTIARQLATHPDHAGRTVYILYPPEPYKDARDWVTATFDADGVDGVYDTVRRIVIDRVYDAAVAFAPPSTNQTTSAKTGTVEGEDSGRVESIDGNDSGDYIRGYGCGASRGAACCVSCGCGGRGAGSRESSPNARRDAIEQLSRRDIAETTPKPKPSDKLPATLVAIIGKTPRWRPCRHGRHRARDGSHPSTVGTFDIIKTTCGKCHACQEKIRHLEKILHCSAALASATHTWDGPESEWRSLEMKLHRLRKKYRVAKPFGYTRVIRDEDGRRVTVFAIPTDLPQEATDAIAEMGLLPIAADAAARLLAKTIDNIPYKLPKFTKRILTNKTWRDASVVNPAERQRDPAEENLYTDLGPVQLQGPDLDWAADAAADEGAEVSRSHLSHFRVEDRIIVRADPEKEDAVARRLLGMSLTQARMAAERKREEVRVRREAREESRRAWREHCEDVRRTKRYYKGREHEAGEFLREWLFN